MRIKNGFELRNVCGENIVISYGEQNIDFCKVISLNETAAYLWKGIGDNDFDVESLVGLLRKEYDVDEQTAHKDISAMLDEWDKIGLITR